MGSQLMLNGTKHLCRSHWVLKKVVIPLVNSERHAGGWDAQRRAQIGNREIVGFGFDGEPKYGDLSAVPFPAIRFREETPEITKLREKEKADWKNLTIAEKKALYRHSFCRTIAEVENSAKGEWKVLLGGVLLLVTVSLWVATWVKVFVMPPLPESTKMENKLKTLEMMVAYRMNAIEGVSSKWDYEKNQWKE